MWKKYFPILHWLPNYNTNLLKGDVVAGITLAAYAIPVSMAYATIAGLPPQCGIYGYLLGGLFYALLGTGRQLAIGPTSAISLLIGTTIASMANGDMQRWVDIASLTALVFSAMSILAYFLRLSGIINFISETVLVGFRAGACLTIGLTQMPKLLGLKGGGESFMERLSILIQQIPETNSYILLFGIVAILILIAGEKFLPGKPVAIVVVVISIVLISATSFGLMGFNTVGLIHSGLPEFHIPSLRIHDVGKVIPLSLACFLLSYIESVSSARTLAQKNGYVINPAQELIALGVANAAVAFGNSYPVAGGLSQSSVNESAGAKTQLSLLFGSITIGLCLLFLTSFLENLPSVILAAIVLVAIRGLLDLNEFKHLYKIDKTEFIVAMIALAGVIIFGILEGVLLAAIATLIMLLKATSNPYVAFLGRIPGTNRYSDRAHHSDNEIIPEILIVRVESVILYFNAENVHSEIMLKVNDIGNIKTVIMDFNSTPRIDIAGARFLKRLFTDLQKKGIQLKIAEARSEVRDKLRSENLEEMLGQISRFVSVNDLVEESKMKTSVNITKQ